jgi:hypothetical protein
VKGGTAGAAKYDPTGKITQTSDNPLDYITGGAGQPSGQPGVPLKMANWAGQDGGAPPFNINAPPRAGQGPYGSVPGAIGLPPVYNDVAGVFPGLAGNVAGASRNIANELAGELDPQTIAMLQNTAAQFGIGKGVPLSPFSGASGLRHLADTVEGQRRKGIEDLNSTLPTIAKTLTVDPNLQAEIANRNATLNAAPDPAAAAAEAERKFLQYMNLLRGQNGFGGGQSNPYAGWGNSYRDPFSGSWGNKSSPAGGTGVFAPGGTTTSRAGSGTLGGTFGWNEDDIYNSLGFGNFGSLTGDTSSPFGNVGGGQNNDLSNWDWDWQAPQQPVYDDWEDWG